MNNTTTLSTLTLVLCASQAHGGFSVVAVDFLAGSPIVASANFVQAPTQTNDLGVAGFGPTGFELSSGLWMSGSGITATEVAPGFTQVTGRPADLAAPSNGGAIVGNTLIGSWLVTAPFEPAQLNSILGPGGGAVESVMVARLSVPTGATIDFASASALVTFVFDGDTGPTQINGANFSSAVGGKAFTAVLFQSGDLLDGQAVDTYDIYFHSLVPSPGAATLAGLAGFTAVRRRR